MNYTTKFNFFIFSHPFEVPSAKLDTAQHWSSIGKNVPEDRWPILCRCWNDNSGMQLVADSGQN